MISATDGPVEFEVSIGMRVSLCRNNQEGLSLLLLVVNNREFKYSRQPGLGLHS